MTPNLNFSLSDALHTVVCGDLVYFLLTGQIVSYNITYNAFEEIVKLSESKYATLTTYYRHPTT